VAQGLLSEAIGSFRSAIEVNPLSMEAHGNLLYAMSIDPSAANDAYVCAARAFGSAVARLVGAPFSDWLVSVDDRSSTKLRVGLVSGKLCNNPVGYFLESVLASIDSSKVELVAYVTSARVDELTSRIRPYFAQWESIVGLDRMQAARKIRADRIDILVDLNGHTEGNLLAVFALKPAPVQVSWLGYWASTGVPGMDYILADEASLPHCNQRYFTETVHYLPETRLCFTAPSPVLPINPPPAIRNRFVTFGSFQARTKLTDAVLALWGQILRETPDARLRLASHELDDAASEQEFVDRLRCAGVDVARVSLVGPVPRQEYLASYALVDIVLDTFPYTGGTTTCEALWMGVPTLTQSGGATMIARQGAAMLACVGLQDWIASDGADYVAKAVAHAADIDGLAVLRRTLRERVTASALFDAPRFARNLEDAFKLMWQHKHNSTVQTPQPIAACRE
jgi:predicted O-linked N-acetylglucosamine transferase (SPINDLY family)